MTIFMDRDGCIVGQLGDYKCNSPSNYKDETMPLIMPTINKLAQSKESLVIISNQGGIGKYISEELVVSQFRWLHDQLKRAEVDVIGSYFCPDSGHSARYVSVSGQVIFLSMYDNYRKPGEGMGLSAQKSHGIPSCYVGDLSGDPKYSPGCHNPASDRQFADAMNWKYLDIQEFLAINKPIQFIESKSSTGLVGLSK